jgi:hypothetical protein
MAKKTVFISFDFDHDKKYKYMLEAWDANTNFDFHISDSSPSEIQSNSVSVVKQVLSRKINEANYTIVIVGSYANSRHADATEIGYKNWQNYEVAKSKEHKNKLIAVKLDNSYSGPDELYNSGVAWASFSMESILKALGR